jgi:hypothetical protein
MNGWLLRPPSVHFRTTSEEEARENAKERERAERAGWPI